jgi:hypothetical protein
MPVLSTTCTHSALRTLCVWFTPELSHRGQEAAPDLAPQLTEDLRVMLRVH